MNLLNKLSTRIHIQEIHEILVYVEGDERRKEELYELIYHVDERVSYRALWVCCHFNTEENEWLYNKQGQLIDEVFRCDHSGKRRMLLNLLLRQPMPDSPRVDFLDFCLERMLSKDEPPAIKALCIKLAYKLCQPIPELCMEFRTILDLMEPDLLPPAVRATHKNIKKALFRQKPISSY